MRDTDVSPEVAVDAIRPMAASQAAASELNPRRRRFRRSPPETRPWPPEAAKPPAQMVEIASKIIDQLEGPLDPSQFNDRYEDALRDLIREKEKGHTITAPEAPKEAEVIDLMDALKRSLGQSGERRRPPARSTGKTARKAPARKSAARKRA
jgi:non-homologous end joining protein Ku